MPRMNQLSNYATTIAADGLGDTVITYHSTPIVRFNPDRVALATGGWDSVTTRRKMHQASIQFRLPYQVFREKGQSYVRPSVGWKARVRGLEDVRGPSAVPLADYVEIVREDCPGPFGN